MKATRQQQEHLLELANLDLEIKRSRRSIADLQSGAASSAVLAELRQSAESLLEARNTLDSISVELQRAETDLNVVDERIARDKQRIEQSSNPKDVQGMQAEIASLAKRKSDLEDLELAILERKEEAEAALEVATQSKRQVEARFADIESNSEQALLKLQSGLQLQQSDRERLLASLGADLVAVYEKRAERGIPVGSLQGVECGACGISINGVALDEISRVAADELAFCPECGAILVR